MFKSITRGLSMLTAVSLLSAGFAIGEPATPKQLAIEKEGVQLINQLEDVSRDVQYNADRLSALNRNPGTSKWSHNHHLMQIKELVNDGLRPALTRLTEIQPELKDWHQDAIDRMLASAKALAADTNSAILTHNEVGSIPLAFNGEYKDLIEKINGHAETLVKTSDAAADYAAAHEQAQEAGLKVPKQ